ncbi:MAG: phenylalanine--tRNA ligase subunit beta [Acidobacteria bacterium]|nr:MAG: phenylalanine--tRNA ligase subunit beta [Acidobacteriota bacterium]
MKVLLSWLRDFVPIDMPATELASKLSLAGQAVDTVEPLAGDAQRQAGAVGPRPGASKSGARGVAALGPAPCNDALLDLDLTSNRPDCLSHYGLAREIAAITGQPLTPLEDDEQRSAGLGHRGPQAGASISGTRGEAALGPAPIIEAPEACGIYCALRLENVHVCPAPEPVTARLQSLGQRSINNIADATNYTLWEMGHPTHAFDYDTLEGGEIRVRWARPGETLTTLDGVTRTLSSEDLVIADRNRPIALAGIMGGLDSSITPKTKRVLLEAAWFDPLTVRKTARRHGLHTEASHRFERGADPQAPTLAAERIACLLGDAVAPNSEGIRTALGNLPQRPTIRLRPAQITRILGKSIEAAECQRLLLALGCELVSSNEDVGAADRREARGEALAKGGASRWLAPSWRPDLTREIDLIEELARLHGYDRFPSRLPKFQGMPQPLPEAALRDRVRQQLRGRGFAEAISLSFASEAECRAFAPDRQPVRVTNPLSEEAAILRTSSFPSMLRLLQYNAHRGNNARLYEIGKLYELGPDGKPRERHILTLGACDAALDRRSFRGEIEAVLAAFALPAPAAEGTVRFQRLHAEAAAKWKLPESTWLAELDLAACYAAGPRPIHFTPPPRFPASDRDFSFLFADAITWRQVEDALTNPPIPLLISLAPAEVFRGGKLPPGHYSLLLRARFQSPDRTLRDDEVQSASAEITARLHSLGGQQR